jgi:uncharacterized MAPEG superfamily protein
MTAELTLLALTVLLGIVQAFLGSETGLGQRDRRWAAGSRDEPMPPLTGVAARLQRAQRNFLETFPLFAAAIVVAHLAGRNGELTFWGAQLYFWGRVIYVPLYASGVYMLRSIVWGVTVVGIGLILLALVL